MSDYRAVVSGGYVPVDQIALSEASGATPFATLAAGRAYTLQVKTGTMRINFTGATGATLDLGPGLYTDTVDASVLRRARVETTTPYTATLLLQKAA